MTGSALAVFDLAMACWAIAGCLAAAKLLLSTLQQAADITGRIRAWHLERQLDTAHARAGRHAAAERARELLTDAAVHADTAELAAIGERMLP